MKNFLIALGLALQGCATQDREAPLTPAEKEAISRLSIYKVNPAAKFRLHGLVRSKKCSQDLALTDLKLKAVKLGARSLVDYRCLRVPSALTGCEKPFQCTGRAVTIR